ncbi:helix-turn-helix domain-containing protein [Peterkaempfera griseoplana]|uniref:helix-turn-helix domain-containing protein n=1 Tax=Peterkaempfera griseoplana TaxID=66896 RepID=UPI0006E23C18|nr:MerR family transcriptional regulator [Peterkaempfera griseoplana]
MVPVPDDLLSIGELARRAGVTVKTVRFYSDLGLLPEAVRSGGGHRRYDAQALERLQLIRSLRALDLPVSQVRRVLDRGESLEDVVARQLGELGSRIAALRRREAALRLLHDCPAGQRAERLRLVGAVASPPGTDAMVRFWRRVLPAGLPVRLRSAVIDAAVPQPPSEPHPEQLLAFARLHALVSPAVDGCLAERPPARALRPGVLYDGLFEAYELACGDVLAGRAPHEGGALDCFVSAHARSMGRADSPGFRRQLGAVLGRAAEPVMDRYWALAAEVTAGAPSSAPARPTLGAVEEWLRAALDDQLARSS